MSNRSSTTLESLRNPEYTGANRCVPCTVVNVVLAVGTSMTIAVASVEVAVVALVAFLLTIYLRGYLVPGTPTLTRRFLPERVLAAFGKVPESELLAAWDRVEEIVPERAAGLDLETYVLEAGIVERAAGDAPAAGGEPADAGQGFRLARPFASSVERSLQRPRADPRDLAVVADLFNADAADAERVERDAPEDDLPEYNVGSWTRKWPSEATLRLDAAIHWALLDHTEDYAERAIGQKIAIREALREFRAACPACGGGLDYDEETVESCCGEHSVFVLRCVDCDERVHERTG